MVAYFVKSAANPPNDNAMLLKGLLLSSVNAHGFMMHPGPISDAMTQPGVRDYGLISVHIDGLRNPVATTQAAAFSDNSKLCRNTGPGRKTAITLTNGQPFTITQALSIGAQHIGPCRIQIMQQGDPSSAVEIASASANGGCARPPLAQFDTDKSPPSAAQQCPGKVPPGLVTDDMCMHEWTFTVRNADKIKCTDCVMRWQWAGEHLMPNREEFESCADVEISNVAQSSSEESTPSKVESPAVLVTSPQPEVTVIATVSQSEVTRVAVDQNEAANPTKCEGNYLQVCNDGGFLVCYPDDPRPAVPMQCAPGTHCRQNSLQIECIV